MKRAQSMAQAAWSRPALRSWSCIGPRRRPSAAEINCNVAEDPLESSSSQRETSEPLLETIEETTTVIETSELSVSSPHERDELKSEFTIDTEVEEDADIMDPAKYQDRMTEVELWQQIERKLYENPDSEEDDTIKEIREEEEEAIAEVSDTQSQSSVPNTKEVHRFFPAGKIMHIVTLVPDERERESDSNASSSDSDNSNPEEEVEVAIFLTRRSLYSKLRLSQTMIADHFMPVYRRQIEKLIRVLENEGGAEEGASSCHNRDEESR